MAITDTINTARERGATDSDILEQIAIQNPDKNETFNQALQRGATPTMIIGEIERQNSTGGRLPDTKKLGFAQRVGQDFQKRVELANEISDATTSGEQSFAEGVLQITGKVGVGGLFDLVGEGVVSLARGVSALTPDVIENPAKDLVTSAGLAFINTPVGEAAVDAITTGFDSYERWKESNPRSARNVESVLDIGLLFAPVSRAKPTADASRLKAISESLESAAESQIKNKNFRFAEELVRPKQTKSVREAQVARTTEKGILRSKQIAPTASEKRIAELVAGIKGVSPSKSLQGNFNAIQTELRTFARSLENTIKKNDFVYPKKELIADLGKAKARLAENPLIVGDAEKTAEKLLNKFEQIIREKPGKGSGVLEARKEFDRWVRSQKGTNIFDPKNESALSIALRELRQTANDFLERSAKNVEVKKSLGKQSDLFRAMDNIAPKAADEANNIALRAWQNTLKVLPFRGEFNQVMALLFGVGGLGASALFAPFLTKLVLGSLFVAGATKVVTGPQTKRILSRLIGGVDTAIKQAKDKQLIEQLRADRAALLEILELVNKEESESR